ncbi:hypothetical protein EIP75_21695 [Aquabacterium soli]|uniref:Uncharacterized protein n=1 Tax=Aquabacterium soli TaxID=2493092 RepID=A0A426V2U7_9BURK|nr:hypothetical protein [Aquabacterium soli]RRS01192.1 hypothetical protein EIP75_21695 [Aquabacterium soli]
MKKSANIIHVLFGLLLLCGSIALVAWFSGVAPASNQEREFIKMLESSSWMENSRVAASVAQAKGANYVSRQHFWAAEDAFVQASHQTSQ